MKQRRLALGAVALTVLLLGLGNVLVWGPLWLQFHVAVDAVDDTVLQRDRLQPGDAVLAVVADASMMTDHPLRGQAAVAAARRILAGELALPSLPPLRIGADFAPEQLEMGVPVQQVFIASLIVPDLLLRAHEHTPDPAFLAAAERYLRGFMAHEARVQFPSGLLANSHTVSNRAAVLARFWRHARTSADAALARDIHTLALRSATLLARPSFFVAATNHGVMQNVALLQLAAAFPALPGADGWRTLAVHRLEQQRPMYIGPDGAVLEHAAGYHFHGVVLSGYVVRLLRETGQPVPAGWLKAHEDARAMLATLQRPDRSLPAIGNTYRYAWRLPALVQPDDEAWAHMLRDRPAFTRTFPVSGTAVWWDPAGRAGEGVQTVIPWGWFARHGHTRAQELSVLIWSAGTDWSTNTGYWPNSDGDGFELANGWDGGNGPHLLGESGFSPRRSGVLAQGQHGALRLLDLERVVAGGPRVRRQVIQWGANAWLVLDSAGPAGAGTLRVLWTGAPETVQQQTGDRAFTLTRPGVPLRFSLAVDGSAGIGAHALSGSRAPFGGWVAFDRRAVPAPAVDARLPVQAGGWMLATLQLSDVGAASAAAARMQRFSAPDDWELQWPQGERPVTLTRHGLVLTLAESGRAPTTLALTPGASVAEALAAIDGADDLLGREYPRFRTAEAWRRQRSWMLAGAWLLAMLALALLSRTRWARTPSPGAGL